MILAAPLAVDEDRRRSQIAVTDLLLVRLCETVGDLPQDGQRASFSGPPATSFAKSWPAKVFGDEIGPIRFAGDVVHMHDVTMIDRRGTTRASERNA